MLETNENVRKYFHLVSKQYISEFEDFIITYVIIDDRIKRFIFEQLNNKIDTEHTTLCVFELFLYKIFVKVKFV